MGYAGYVAQRLSQLNAAGVCLLALGVAVNIAAAVLRAKGKLAENTAVAARLAAAAVAIIGTVIIFL